MRESRSSGNLRKRAHLGEEERQRFLYHTELNNYIPKRGGMHHFEFNAAIDTNVAELNAEQKDKNIKSI